MNIRFATKGDKNQVLKLLDELGEEIINKNGHSSYNNTKAQKVGGDIFNEIISRKDTLIFVAEEKGELIGLVTFYLLPNIRHGWHRGHIEDVIVSKTKRSQGIGSQLFKAIKKYCKKNDIKVIKLDSGIELINAHKFYEKNGGKFTEKMFRFDIAS